MIQKAMLQIDCSKGTKKNGSVGEGLRAGIDMMADVAQRLKQTASARRQDSAAKDSSTPDMVSQGGMARDAMDQNVMQKNGMITVQYNPASIKYHASGSTQQDVQTYDVGEKTETVNTITRNSSLDVSFELVFHKKDDADDSVREQMELVMKMINQSPTKNVKFAWREIAVDGKLVSFLGEYDMFDESGNPVSGHMNMTIQTVMSDKFEERILDKMDNERQNTRNGDT